MLDARRRDCNEFNAALSIVIVSDIRLYREPLAWVLTQLNDVGHVATCETAVECITIGRRSTPDIILLDMSSSGSAASARLFAREFASTRIVALAVPETEPQVLACVEAGVTGYVPREGSIDDLVTAIRHAARGEAVCSPVIAAGLMRRVATLARDTSSTSQLTTREMQIAEHVLAGMSNRLIATQLGIELCTVKNHVHNILEKLGVARRADIAGYIQA
jgi:DNA-binding NarL/FixJ family response regulator